MPVDIGRKPITIARSNHAFVFQKFFFECCAILAKILGVEEIDDISLVEAKTYALKKLKLIVYYHRGDDQPNGDKELENNQRISNSIGAHACADTSAHDFNWAERSEVERWIASGERA